MHRDWRPLALVTQVGLTIVVTLVLCLLLGLWIDNRFGTKPWATLVLTLVGIVAGSVSVYRMVSEAIAAAAAEQREPGSGRSGQSRKRRKENE